MVEWLTVGVAVMVSVSEDPAVSLALGSVQYLDLGVILTVQRCLTYSLVLVELHLILGAHTGTCGEEGGDLRTEPTNSLRLLNFFLRHK